MAYERRDLAGAAVSTTLGAGINAAAASFTIADGTGWPDGSAGDFFVVIDPGNSSEEKIRCSELSGTTVTVQTSGRGADGTSATTHSTGATVKHVYTALDADEANYWVSEIAAATNTAGDLLVADGADSLTTLAKGANNRVLKVNGSGTLGYAQADSDDIAAGAIDLAHMSANSVDSDQYVDGSIDLIHMSANSVDSDQYVDGSIDGVHIANDAIDSQHYAAGSIDNEHLADGDTVTIAETADEVLSHVATFSRTGTLATGTGTMRFRFPYDATLKHTRLSVGTAPTGANLIVDVHKGGTTVYTTQANRPTITATEFNENDTDTPDVTAVSAGDYLTVDIDQVGSTIAGVNLVVNVYYVLV